MSRTALIIEVPEAERLVQEWRHRHDPVAAQGVPAHITVLHPFVPPRALDASVLDGLATVLSKAEPFDFALTKVDQFPGAVWLRPEPDQPFRGLTKLIWNAFPDFPPYGGEYPDSQPHLTVALSDSAERQGSLVDELNAETGVHLPLAARASVLSIFVSDDAGAWTRKTTLALGA